MLNDLPLFKSDPCYQKADRWKFSAHAQTFVLYEFSIGFVSHRLFRDQFEEWLSTMGRYLAGHDDTPATKRRLQDLAWHLWFRGRPAHDASKPAFLTGIPSREPPRRYRELLTEDMRPLFEESTFWLAERLNFDRDLGHIWKVLVRPLHIARTRESLENLILHNSPSPWRSMPGPGSSTFTEWTPDLPSRRWR